MPPEDIDPDDLDFSGLAHTLYPGSYSAWTFLTSLTIGFVLWVALLVAGDYLSVAELRHANLPINDLLNFAVYGYFAVAFGISTALSGALWYVSKAPSSVRDRLDQGPTVNFIIHSIINIIIFLLIAAAGYLVILGGLVALVIGLLLLLGALLLGVLMLIAGIFSLDLEMLVAGIAVLLVAGLLGAGVGFADEILPAGVPTEVYALGVTYLLAVIATAALPFQAVRSDVEQYGEQLSRLRVARSLIEAEQQRLQEKSPTGRDIQIQLPEIDPSGDLEAAERTATTAFSLIDAYDLHIETEKKVRNHGYSDVGNLLSTAAELTHPNRCASPDVALDAAEAFDHLVSVCEQNETQWPDDIPLEEPQIRQVCRDIAATDTTTQNDIERLEEGIHDFGNWLSKLEDYIEFSERVDDVSDRLNQIFDGSLVVDINTETVNGQQRERLEHYERVLELAEQLDDLSREYVESPLPEAALKQLHYAANEATPRDSDQYELLVEAIEQALTTSENHSSRFTESVSTVLEIARTDPIARSEELEAVLEVLERGSRIATFLETVDQSHPSVNVNEWEDALSTADRETFPNVLRPIDRQVEAMREGLWEKSDLFSYDWQEFESLVGSLYADEGYNVEITSDTNDEGVDVWARSPEETIAIQVKQNSEGNTVGRRVLQRVASAIAKGTADKVVVVTSSEFANTAVEYATEFGTEMELIDGEDLVQRLSTSNVPPPQKVEP